MWIACVAHSWCYTIDPTLATFICRTTIILVWLFPLQDTSSTVPVVKPIQQVVICRHVAPCIVWDAGTPDQYICVWGLFSLLSSLTGLHIHAIQFIAYRILNNMWGHTGRFDGPRIEPRWGRYFPHPWDQASLLYNGYRVLPGGKAAGAWRLSLTPSSAEVKERVELYLYSPYGPSWPVLGCTSPLTLQKNSSQYIIRIFWSGVKMKAIVESLSILDLCKTQ